MELELLQLLAPDLPSHKQVNLTQRLTKCQSDLMYYCSWPLDVCTGGKGGGIGVWWMGEYIWPNISLTHSLIKCHADLQEYHSWALDACTGGGGVLLKTQDGLLNTADNRTWAQVNGTQVSTTLGHQMPLSGEASRGHRGVRGTSEQTSAWPTGWPNVMLTCSSATLDH